LLELAGVAVPAEQDIDGLSLAPLLRGESIADRPLFWHYPHYGNQGGEPSSIIIQNDWKLIYYHEDGRNEIYHLADDPYERHDLADSDPDRTRALRKKLDEWLSDTGAKFPTKDPLFDASKRDARWETLMTQGKARLERRHASFLRTDFRPNRDWWGSATSD